MEVILRPRSVWEVLTCKPQKAEVEFYHPLQIKIHSTVTLKRYGLDQYQFNLDRIREYTRTVGGKDFVFTDYEMSSNAPGRKAVSIVLRVIPIEGASKHEKQHNTIVLWSDYESPFEAGIQDAFDAAVEKKCWHVNEKYDEADVCPCYGTALSANAIFCPTCGSRRAYIPTLNPGEERDTDYWRLNEVGEAYRADVAILTDQDENGILEQDEIENTSVLYADFGVERPTYGDATETEFYFVERDETTKYFRMLRGYILIDAKVEVA